MKANDEKLIFVYNSDSGILGFSAPSHKCRLSALAKGTFGMNSKWKNFIRNLDKNPSFLHKNEFLKMYPSVKTPEFPAVYRATPFNASLFIRSNDINQCAGLDDLIDLVVEKLK